MWFPLKDVAFWRIGGKKKDIIAPPSEHKAESIASVWHHPREALAGESWAFLKNISVASTPTSGQVIVAATKLVQASKEMKGPIAIHEDSEQEYDSDEDEDAPRQQQRQHLRFDECCRPLSSVFLRCRKQERS
mmetsp:Transcript_35651/g.49928  ORF Transcript_35651/g.49928 Transcript_35651/m.49928 type:complete len:133 (-) Transcript_35651:477-875(-)